jgi:hypothetical protein
MRHDHGDRAATIPAGAMLGDDVAVCDRVT